MFRSHGWGSREGRDHGASSAEDDEMELDGHDKLMPAGWAAQKSRQNEAASRKDAGEAIDERP